ncbi:hypothetical protein EYF80_044576 [Liparis tanakae]|uniref:Uncharacterized protein n=1 Tax=Liparis tanakae TaxID=230148 RepID=A0A4Z2FWS2_9TELE|nr:hypothetical protein EYF80_044576 [Liparis tanakae]
MRKTSFLSAELRISVTCLAFMASGFSHSTFFLASAKSRQALSRKRVEGHGEVVADLPRAADPPAGCHVGPRLTVVHIHVTN